MATHDAKAFVHLDFYSILGLDALCDQKDIDRAWRKFALKYHPDKVSKDRAADAEAFYHNGRIGKEILSDTTAKQIYDDARAARERKRQQDELLDARRKKLRDDLDQRERGVKRTFDGGVTDEDEATKLEREVQRIAADGKRRRLEREAQIREERQRKAQEREKARQPEPPIPVPEMVQPSATLPDIDRTVRARFKQAEAQQTIDAATIEKIFQTFGNVENVFMMKDKKERLPGSEKKVLVGRCGITFTRILDAYEAVEEWRQRLPTDTLWQDIIDITWAGGKVPDCITNIDVQGEPSLQALTAQEQVMIKLKKSAAKKQMEV